VGLEDFRPDQRHKQVDQQTHRDESNQYVFHDSQSPACVRVRDAKKKEAEGHADENQILHKSPA
jgi:hypothetical protein